MANIGRHPNIVLPEYIQTILYSMKWQVLTFEIDVGYPLRFLLNWVIARINERYNSTWENDQAINTSLGELQSSTSYSLAAIITWAGKYFTKLEGMIEGGIVSIDNYKYTIQGWFTQWHRPSAELLLAIKDKVYMLEAQQNSSFWEYFNPSWVLQQIGGALDTALRPFFDLEDERRNLFEWIWLIFADPPKFFYELFDDIIERYW